jgi:hypothetical protein
VPVVAPLTTRQDAFISTSNWSGDYFIRSGGACVCSAPASPYNALHDCPQQLDLVADTVSSTAGVSLVMSGQAVVQQLQAAFDRDWDSAFAVPLL